MKLFYLGSNIHRDAIQKIELTSNDMLIYEQRDVESLWSEIESLKHAERVFSIDKKAIISRSYHLETISSDTREKILFSVLSDFQNFLLRTRFSRFDVTGAFEGLCYFSDVVDSALDFATKNKFDLVYSSYTPHTLEAWLFLRTLEEMGIPIIRLISSPLPWILMPVKGLMGDKVGNVNFVSKNNDYGKLNKYTSVLKKAYTDAIPYYEKRTKFFSLSKISLLKASLRPSGVFKKIEKLLVHKEFKEFCTTIDVNSLYAVYFLHHQPEMNTVPEAGLYCDQLQVIKKLASSLPAGIKLVVKEHPSTFSKRCDRRWRPKNFYKKIISLKISF